MVGNVILTTLRRIRSNHSFAGQGAENRRSSQSEFETFSIIVAVSQPVEVLQNQPTPIPVA